MAKPSQAASQHESDTLRAVERAYWKTFLAQEDEPIGDSDEEWLTEEFRRLRYAGGIQ